MNVFLPRSCEWHRNIAIPCGAWLAAAIFLCTFGVEPLPAEDLTDDLPLGPRRELTQKSPEVAWVADIGGCAGPIVVSGENVFVGTNNQNPRDEKKAEDAGVLMCFARDSGKYKWQILHPRLTPSDRRRDRLVAAVESRPWIEGDRAYYISTRGELLCIDISDKLFSTTSNSEEAAGATNSKSRIVWKLDFIKDLGVFKRDSVDIGNSLCSPIVLGDQVFCLTGHGVRIKGEPADKEPPSFLAVNKMTGKVAWSSNAPNANLVFAQWSSPIAVKVDQADQIIFPGGDGILYAFAPSGGRSLWKLDCNALCKHEAPKGVEGRGFNFPRLLAEGPMLYGALNQGLETWYDHRFPIFALDLSLAAKTGTPKVKWKCIRDENEFGILGPVATHEGLMYFLTDGGFLHAIDMLTGEDVWRHDLLDQPSDFGGPVIAHGKLYVPTVYELYVLRPGKRFECSERLTFDQIVVGPPVVDKDRLYVTTQDKLWAIRLKQ